MRIVIVEDEIRIRMGLENLVRKISEDSEIVACAEDGQEGLEAVLEFHPDLVITDIRMPNMNGLEMLSLLHEKNRLPKTIVISAYSEFEYARQAIRLGVSEYILKPISVTEFTNSFKNIENQIRMEKEKSQNESFQMIMEQELHYGNILNSHLKKILWDNYQFDTDAKCCIVPIYFEEEKVKKNVKRDFERLWKNYESVRVQFIQPGQGKMELAFLYNYSDEKQLERWFQNRAATDFAKEYGRKVCFGWTELSSAADLKETYKLLGAAMEWNLILGKGVVVSYPKVTLIQTEPVIYPIAIEQEMREGLCMMNVEKMKKTERKFLEYFQRGVIHAPGEVKEAFVRFIWSILNIVKEVDIICYEKFEQPVMLDKIMTAVMFQELEDSLDGVLEMVCECEVEGQPEEDRIISRMKNMVHEFYNQGITLDEIAAELQMTPEYLGTQFRKKTGMTYSTYLKQYRIEKAKKMLIGTELKTYEIAQKVGYTDPKYFSKVFKEVTGELPGDYKKRH